MLVAFFHELLARKLTISSDIHHADICFGIVGSNFNMLLQRIFGSSHIEDLWIPYFNISTDITSSKMSVHRSGKFLSFCC